MILGFVFVQFDCNSPHRIFVVNVCAKCVLIGQYRGVFRNSKTKRETFTHYYLEKLLPFILIKYIFRAYVTLISLLNTLSSHLSKS